MIRLSWPRWFFQGRSASTKDHSRQACIRGPPKDWRRRTGRPRQTWLRTVEDDLRPLNFGLETARRRACDRSACRLLMEAAIRLTVKRYSSPEQVVSELRGVNSCHMGSHSVTCHPTQVNVPRLTPSRQADTRFPEGCKAELTCVVGYGTFTCQQTINLPIVTVSSVKQLR